MFITPTATVNSFAVLLDATVTVHQIIQNAADFAVLMKTEPLYVCYWIGYRPIHSASNTNCYAYLYMACSTQGGCGKKHCHTRLGYRLLPWSK